MLRILGFVFPAYASGPEFRFSVLHYRRITVLGHHSDHGSCDLKPNV